MVSQNKAIRSKNSILLNAYESKYLTKIWNFKDSTNKLPPFFGRVM